MVIILHLRRAASRLNSACGDLSAESVRWRMARNGGLKPAGGDFRAANRRSLVFESTRMARHGVRSNVKNRVFRP